MVFFAQFANLLAFLVRANTGATAFGTIMPLLFMWTNAASSTFLALASLLQVGAQPIALALHAKVPLSTVLTYAAA